MLRQSLPQTSIDTAYRPLPWQIPALRDKSPVVLLSGAAGGGKSRCAAEKVNLFMLQYPGSTGLMLRKARQWCHTSIVPFFNNRVLGKSSYARHHKSMFTYDYYNGSQLFYGGMKDDDQREAIRSIGQDGALDFVWLEEGNAFIRDDFDELIVRMRGKAAGWSQILISTNPDHPYHWINQDLIVGGEASVHLSSWKENPYNPPDYKDKLAKLRGVKRQRLVEGKWVQAEGVVYDEFEPSHHIIDPFDIPADWPRYRVIDFGFTNPFVCLWYAIGPDDTIYVYREIYMTQRIIAEHAKQIIRLDFEPYIQALTSLCETHHIKHNWAETEQSYVNFYETRQEVRNLLSTLENHNIDHGLSLVFPQQTVCDHDAEDRATLDSHGIYNIPADKDVSTGIDGVKERLAIKGNGKAGIYFFRNMLVEKDETIRGKPHSTLQEFLGYIWDIPEPDKENKDRPVKLNDHGMDDVRYLVKHADTRGSFILFDEI